MSDHSFSNTGQFLYWMIPGETVKIRKLFLQYIVPALLKMIPVK